ncbi:2-dehydropantoate 2-reductase [Pseudaeromonas paramecii]|uniref:2-dehydropantoate 2-reductase n=1 Tax=Pseudaeromonas paramecii TaxID=2138166 RepID=A0ABP8QEC1_9GAMM
MESLRNWTILGCGAIGGMMAGLLSRAGHQVSLLRTDKEQVTLPIILRFEDLDGQIHQVEPDFLLPKDADNISLLLVTTKAYQVAPAMTPLIDRLPTHTPILLLHNGMGTEDWVKDHFPDNPLLIGITSNGALLVEPEHIRHTGPGETWIGAANPAAQACRPLVELLAQALPHAAWSEQIHRQQWTKLVINAVINPLTALNNIPNGELIAFQADIQTLCRELLPLLAQQGFSAPEKYWVDKVLQVASLTASNYSSMHQDLARGRPSEIDAMTGFLLAEARRLGLSLPAHQALYDKIKAKENSHE